MSDPKAPSPVTQALIFVGHLARVAFGLVFLAAAITKSIDPALFAEQIAEYELTPTSWSTWQAYLFIVLEMGLGVALIVNLRPRLTIPAGVALMALFIGVLAVAMSRGYTGECGCFGGASSRGPKEAIAEDLFFLGAGLLAWMGMRAAGGFARRGRRAWQLGITVGALAAGVLAPIAAPALPLPGWATAAKPGGRFDHIVIEGFDENLNEGDYVAALLDPTADASIEVVDGLNALSGADGVPQVVGVFQGDNEAMVAFLFEHAPAFDGMGHAPRVAMRPFFRRLPVVLALRDATILAAWHERVPTADDVRQRFASPPAVPERPPSR